MKILIPAKPKLIIDRLLTYGHQAGLVGGCLRNIILGLPVKDYDIATSATAEEMKQVFNDLTIISLGEKFGTLIIVVDRENIEVTTFRKESSYQDNRHPDSVEFVDSIEEDLKRRDFTINALFYNDRVGLIDMFHSIDDMNSRIIKAVGNPIERFQEDSLRILRGLRFAARLNFRIESDTSKAILQTYPLLANIKAERIAVEIVEILSCNNIGPLIGEYIQVFQQIVPDLDHVDTARLDEMMTLKLKLAVFFSSIKKPIDHFDVMMTLKLTVSSRLRKSDLKDIGIIISYKDRDISNIIQVYREIKWNKALLKDIYTFFNQAEQLETLPDIEIRDLKVTADDIKKLGYPNEMIQQLLDVCFSNLLTKNVPNDKLLLCDLITELYPK